MPRFVHAHAAHPDWREALERAAAHVADSAVDAGGMARPTLGWVYFTDHYAADAPALLDALRARWPSAAWVGASGVGIAASGVEYFDEPALALMLTDLPAERFRIYSGAAPLGDFAAATAQIHADPETPELAELVDELCGRTSRSYLFGGLASARDKAVQIADGVWHGGLSGVAFDADVALVSRVTQGCQPIGPLREVTTAERHLVAELDGSPALDCLLRDLQLEGADPRGALATLRQVLVGLSDAEDVTRSDPKRGAALQSPIDGMRRRGAFGADTRVRSLVGLDPGRRAIAVGDVVQPGMQLAFCMRNAAAAKSDLVRICAEVREEVEPESLPSAVALTLKEASPGERPQAPPASGIAGAIYVSCAGRGGPHFGAPSAELALVRHALGDVPLVGFFAAGEIAHRHLYGYTGVLTVFADRA